MLQHELPTGSQPEYIHLLQHGIIPGEQVDFCSIVDLQGHSCLTMVLQYALQRESLLQDVENFLPFAPRPLVILEEQLLGIQ